MLRIINSKRKQRKLYDKADFEKIRQILKKIWEEINNINWKDQLGKYNNVDDMRKFFHSNIMEIQGKFIPTRSNRNRKKREYPLDKKTLDKIKLEHKLCKKVIAKRGPQRQRNMRTWGTNIMKWEIKLKA